MNKRPTCGFCEKNEAYISYLNDWICGECLLKIQKERNRQLKEYLKNYDSDKNSGNR